MSTELWDYTVVSAMKRNKTGKGARKCWKSAILSRVVRKASPKKENKLNKDLKITRLRSKLQLTDELRRQEHPV